MWDALREEYGLGIQLSQRMTRFERATVSMATKSSTGLSYIREDS